MGIRKRFRKTTNEEVWEIDYFDEARKRRAELIGPVTSIPKRRVKEILYERRKAVRANRQAGFVPRDMTLAELIDEVIQEYCPKMRPGSLKDDLSKVKLLKQVAGEISIRKVDGAFIKDRIVLPLSGLKYLDKNEVLRSVGPGRVAAIISFASTCFHYAVDIKKYLFSNPFVGIRRAPDESRDIEMTTREIDNLLIEAFRSGSEHFPWVLLLEFNTLISKSDLFHLRWPENINRLDRRLRYTRHKSGVPVKIWLNDEACLAVDMLPRCGDYLIAHADSTPLSDCDTAFKRARQRAGRPDLRFHDIRHIGATKLEDLEFGERVIDYILAHSLNRRKFAGGYPSKRVKWTRVVRACDALQTGFFDRHPEYFPAGVGTEVRLKLRLGVGVDASLHENAQ